MRLSDAIARLKVEQFGHQAEEFKEHRHARARAWLWQMRTGKSKQGIDNACVLYEEDRIDAVLVLAPNGPHLSWGHEHLPKHMWSGIEWRSFCWKSTLTSKAAKEASARELDEMVGNRGDEANRRFMRWVIVNTEALRLKRVKAALMRLLKRRRVMLIVDESDDYRSPGSSRSIRVRGMARRCAYRRILTGTVIANSPLAAWAQYEILEKGALGFERYAEFENRYAVYKEQRTRGGRAFPVLDGYRNEDELSEAMAAYSSVVLREDCPDLPELIETVRRFEMTPAQASLYDSVREQCCVRLAGLDEEQVRMGGGALLIKLQQVTSGWVVDEEGEVMSALGKRDENPRLEATVQEIKDGMDKAVVWCRFRRDIDLVAERCRREGWNPVIYRGGQARANEEAKRLLQTDRTVRVLVGQPASGGRGNDMSAAGLVVWHSHVHDMTHRLQASERATIVGKTAVGLSDVVCEGSVDDGILESLWAKRGVFDKIAGVGLRDRLLRIMQGE